MIFKDGRFVDRSPAVEPPCAIEGVFSTVGCEGGKPLLWPRHRMRLQNSINALFPDTNVVLPDQMQLEELLTVEGCRHDSARLRCVVWRDKEGVLRVEAAVSKLVSPKGPRREPVRLAVVVWDSPPDPAHKWVSRWAWDEAQRVARERACDDALIVDHDGRVLETSIANIFVRVGKTLISPIASRDCLPGVMRAWVTSVADVKERELDLESLLNADEVWLTNAVAGVVRVGSIADRTWTTWRVFNDFVGLGVPAPAWP